MRLASFAVALCSASILLAGCGTQGATSPATESSPSPAEPAVTSCSDPLAGDPTTVNARELAFCQTEAVGNLAGYVQEDTINGKIVSTSRVNLDPLAVEIKSNAGSNGDGSWVILVAGKAYVNLLGKWYEARADSDDETLQYQSSFPSRFEALLNPEMRAMATDPELEYAVEGRETVNGHDVRVLSLTVNEGTEQEATSTVYIRDDYVVVRSQTEQEIDGHTQLRVSDTTHLDEAQEIINPMYRDK